jgi:hypothetical protein
MGIGVILSGFIAGLFGIVVGLSIGLPLWLVILLYPLAGTAGAIALIVRATQRSTANQGYTSAMSSQTR